ncbi:hypothetical protein TgHK011_010026 [Trichoderma gracile]|nr:hypothetical protein TgHK011_010026 [Trichoderma gracile]
MRNTENDQFLGFSASTGGVSNPDCIAVTHVVVSIAQSTPCSEWLRSAPAPSLLPPLILDVHGHIHYDVDIC